MANNASLGLPQILITFSSRAATAINRSSRGVGAMILNDENVTDDDGVKYSLVEDTTDIPTDISDSNADLIKKGLLGTPLKVHCYFIPPATHEEEQTSEKVVESVVTSDVTVTKTVESDVEVTKTVTSDVTVQNADTGETETVTSDVTVTETVTSEVTITETVTSDVTVTDTVIETATVEVAATVTQADALKKAADVRFNYICHPTGGNQEQQDLASWVKAQRKNRQRTVKAVVANYDADDYGVINFTTSGIKTDNPAYLDALELVDGDTSQISADIPQYLTYTANQYTARIMGIMAGVSLDRSTTYYELSEVVSVDEYDDIDEHINNGELCLFDEKDDNGVKIARGCNSLHTFTSDVGQDFRFIKIVEGLDLIKDDIRDTFRNEYVGKVRNTYDNKMLFIAAIHSYFNGLKGNVLDPSATSSNYVEIDYEANRDYAKMHGASVADMNEQAILEYNTGTNVFLRGMISPVNAMEDLKLDFTLS